MEVSVLLSFIAAALTLLYAGAVLYFLRGWNNIPPYEPKHHNSHQTTMVSVIVAARNEEQHLPNLLGDLIAQSYNRSLTEIIIVDDHSTDSTPDIVSSYRSHGIKLIRLHESEKLNSYKKKAIQTAIAECRGTLIITTDADCRMGREWLKTIVNFYEQEEYKMISSPVSYHAEISLFERAQSLEFLYLIGLGAASIGNRMPSTCNGANLAYEKTAFYEVGGFRGIDDLASGDDELLLHKIAARYPGEVGFLKSRDAIVYTHAKPNLAAFIQQRKRWSSKSTRYKNKGIIALGVFIWMFNLSILISLLSAIVNLSFLHLAVTQLAVKMIVEFIFLRRITAFADRTKLLVLVPLLSFMHILYIVYIGIAGNSGKYRWKGRMVR